MSGAAVHDSARVLAKQLASLLLDDAWRRGDFRGSAEHALLALALDAAMWRSDRDGSELPGSLRDMCAQRLTLPDKAVRMQREWLDAADSDEVRAECIPELAYRLGDRGDMFELLSSDSMRHVAAVAALAGRSAGHGPFRILDLAAGSGSMLFSVAQAADRLGYDARPMAVELNPNVAAVAAATFYLADRDAAVEVADSLVHDPFSATHVELAISQPPFGLGWHHAAARVEERQHEGWYRFGLPPRADASWLFASRLIEKLVPVSAGGGRAITFMALGALRSPATSGIRERLLEDDLVETIIALPAGLTQASVPVFAVVFNNAKPSRRKGRIQLVDLRALSETSRFRDAPRRLRPGALDTLQQALQSTRDGVISRTVARDYFMKVRRIICVGGPIEATDMPTSPAWYVDLPRDSDVEMEMQARYGPIEVRIDDAHQTRCDLDVESVFDVGAPSLRGWMKRTGWEATRLSALLTEAPTAIGGAADGGAEFDGSVLLPTTASNPATLGALGDHDDSSARRRLALHLDATKARPDFVVGWLNSPLGVEARRRAQAAASSGTVIHAMRTEPHTLLRFCDDLVVPLPPLNVQRNFAAAEARMAAAAGLVAAAPASC
jgi:type I restriction enzyme M protein